VESAATRAGFPGEVDEQGRIQKINVVPKPHQKPHPTLFQAFSVSEETVRWCAQEGIIPTILLPQPPVVRKLVEAYQEESRKAGRNLKLGENIGVLHAIYFGENKAQARKLGAEGICGVAFKKFFHQFGFSEAWHEEGDEARLSNWQGAAARVRGHDRPHGARKIRLDRNCR
jgi:alkanesulfonate monooxygenase SsuD/methylene tetrahydromethanopterin reductase-like flavin-dependent oxidoreductase (luciferase family)